MFSRAAAALGLVAILALAACNSAAPALSDPREIVTQGIEATSNLKSFHFEVAVDGTFSVPDLGGEFSLDGTSVDGDFNIEEQQGRIGFAIPALLGFNGEALLIGDDVFVKTSMTGELWSRSDATDAGTGTDVTDPEAMLADVRAFLDEEGVEVEKLGDVDCGDGSCYQVRLTIPSALLSDAGDAAGMDAGEVFGEALVVDLQFDREDLYLANASTSVASDATGTFSLTLTLSAFDAPVEVSPPPSDQVTEGGGLPF